MMTKVAPSILSADFARLGDEVVRAESCGADWLHIDVMDGSFVPNITIGPGVISAIRGWTEMTFDVHLMIQEPVRHVKAFAEAGADILTVHAEACEDLAATVDAIRGAGMRTGVSVNPSTPLEAVRPLLGEVDLLLVMTVPPGFGGQRFRDDCLPKVSEARRLVDRGDSHMWISVDGGINRDTGRMSVEAGADVLAAGSALFKADDMAREIALWKTL